MYVCDILSHGTASKRVTYGHMCISIYAYVYVCMFVLPSAALHNSLQLISSSLHIAHSVTMRRNILWQKGVQLAVTRCQHKHTCIGIYQHTASSVKGSKICIFMYANDCTMITLEFRSRLGSFFFSAHNATATSDGDAVAVEHIKMREKCSLI